MVLKRTILFLTVVYLVLVTILSLVPLSDIDSSKIPYFDKLIHICFYWGLNILLLWNIASNLKSELNIRNIIYATLISVAYSVVIEFLQPLTDRNCDLEDIVANSVGAITGATMFYIVRGFKNRFTTLYIIRK